MVRQGTAWGHVKTGLNIFGICILAILCAEILMGALANHDWQLLPLAAFGVLLEVVCVRQVLAKRRTQGATQDTPTFAASSPRNGRLRRLAVIAAGLAGFLAVWLLMMAWAQLDLVSRNLTALAAGLACRWLAARLLHVHVKWWWSTS